MSEWVLDADSEAIRFLIPTVGLLVTKNITRGVYQVSAINDASVTFGVVLNRLVIGPHGSLGVAQPNSEGNFRSCEVFWFPGNQRVFFHGGEYDFTLAAMPAGPANTMVVLQRMRAMECLP